MNIRPLIAEFIGTFTLIFIGVGAIAADYTTQGALGLTGIALAHGLAIAVMVSATAAVSGGHLNPAVTVGLWTAQKIDSASAVGYVIAQCFGAIAAAYCITLIIGNQTLTNINFGIPALAESTNISAGLITEIILTFFLVFVVYGTGVDKRAPKTGGLFIGLAVTLDILMGGPITGAAMNPARHLGPALVSGNGLSHTWLYWAGPIGGGVLAAQIYRNFLEEK